MAITSATSGTLSLKRNNFAPLIRVRLDGETFLDTKQAFEAELVRQAAELQNSRAGQQPYLHHLMAGVSRSTPSLHDELDFRLHMDTQRERTCRGVPFGEAGSPPTFPEFYIGSEATSLDEFPAAVLRSLDGFCESLLCSAGPPLKADLLVVVGSHSSTPEKEATIISRGEQPPHPVTALASPPRLRRCI